ncbi:MAG: TIGR04086 family membrane protein [Acetobacteraceae bacterium]|nr:TIGR04086 family membrane protein [Acetobacteraceae bacterium]
MLAGTVLAGLLWLVLSLVVAAVLCTTPVGERSLPVMAAAVACVSVFAGGVFAGRRAGVAGWAHGGAVGVLAALVAWVVGAAFSLPGSWAWLPLRLVYGFLAGAAGGVFGANI